MSGVAVVSVVHGRHEHLAAQHRSLARGSRLPDVYTVVAMDDPLIGEDEVEGLVRGVVGVDVSALGLPLAGARNLGVRRAFAAGMDVVVLLDVDCLAGRDLVASYAEVARAHPERLWSGPVTYLAPSPGGYDLDDLDALDDPHPARPAPAPGQLVCSTRPELFWSLSFAVSAPAWDRIGGFCEDYVGYGAEDTGGIRWSKQRPI